MKFKWLSVRSGWEGRNGGGEAGPFLPAGGCRPGQWLESGLVRYTIHSSVHHLHSASLLEIE